jgi:hypothetical protein
MKHTPKECFLFTVEDLTVASSSPWTAIMVAPADITAPCGRWIKIIVIMKGSSY